MMIFQEKTHLCGGLSRIQQPVYSYI